MRLVCPKCETLYDVPEDAIPEAGRDVECANCGHSWFQTRVAPPSMVALPVTADEVGQASSEPTPPTEAEAAPAVDAPITVEAPAAEINLAEVKSDDVIEPSPTEDPTETAPEIEPAPSAVTSVDVAPLEDVSASVVTDTPAEAAPESEPEPAAAPFADMASLAEPDPVATAEADAVQPVEPPPVKAEPEVAISTESSAPPSSVAQETQPEPEAEPAAVGAANAEVEDEEEPQAATTEPALPAYAVDDSVLAILREEAEREAEARRSGTVKLESQTDLGLDAVMPRRSKSGKGASVGAGLSSDGDESQKSSARRDLLPDVEEINSTLRPADMPPEDFVHPTPPPNEVKGFRSGFMMVIAIAIVGAAIYTTAPRLSVMAPVLASPLEAYVGLIDSLRLSLDGVMQSATEAISDS